MSSEQDLLWHDRLERLLGVREVLEDAYEYVRRKRTLDYSITPGQLSLRVTGDLPGPITLTVTIEPIQEEIWDEVFTLMAQRAKPLATLLRGDLSEKLLADCLEVGADLIPDTPSLARVRCTTTERERLYLGALFHLVRERIESDPFAAFTLRGKTKEQVLFRLRQERQKLRGTRGATGSESREHEPLMSASHSLSSDAQAFWSLRKDILQLSYDIRADELPAAILRRLDALPLGDISVDVDQYLSHVYEHVAKRAQALGLGFRHLDAATGKEQCDESP